MLRLAKIGWLLTLAFSIMASPPAAAQERTGGTGGGRQLYAEVVALDQVISLNRRGAALPQGMIFALRRDVVPSNCYANGGDCTARPHAPFDLQPGQVMLRRDKRPRPIVLRLNVGDRLTIRFWNLLNPTPSAPVSGLLPKTRTASMHLMGTEWTSVSTDDGSNVGSNPNSLMPPTPTTAAPLAYTLQAHLEGGFLLFSSAANIGGYAGLVDGAQLASGLFGAVHVEPAGSVWYRSQITRQDLQYATTGTTADGHPILEYDAVYPPGAGDRAGSPVLQMVDAGNNIVATDLTAIIAPPFTPPPPPNYAEPARQRAYREFTIIYHEANDAVQAFNEFYGFNSNAQAEQQRMQALRNANQPQSPDWALAAVLNAGQDNFAINYGTGGIGAEVLANRLGVGPEGGCADCKFEEFFLSSWAVGDPAQVVEYPGTANSRCTTEQLTQATLKIPNNAPCFTDTGAVNSAGYMVPNRKARRVLYPDDPSNVYHSYINDHVIFRILHGGSVNTHVHHQHAHQWLHTENSQESTYLDSQMITMGAAYTLNIAYNGGGNRNKTVGDSIFHCHFYPHFAAGMWSLWRTHDVFEGGTMLDREGIPSVMDWNRSLPDGEIAAGTPIPAIVPLPDMPMAPIPARVKLVSVNADGLNVGNTSAVHPDDVKGGLNPGFPFFIPGIGGMRGPHPPLDFAVDKGQELNGGLPRHIVFTGAIENEKHDRFDFSKNLKNMNAMQLPEDGTYTEKVAMNFHSVCFHDSFFPDGTKGSFRTNGLPPAPGAPYADPALDPVFENYNREDICTNNRAHPVGTDRLRRYRAAVFQTDLVFNKLGWHFPQSRMLSLWSDVRPTLGDSGQVPRPPQPFFFRANSGEAVEYWHTNLVPDYYLLDDYQVRTPTDIIGQHIHLVKFDVTSSDGAGNGFNYEDGTFSPDDVRTRIDDINVCGGLLQWTFDPFKPYANIPNCGSGTTYRAKKQPTAPPQEICTGIPDGSGQTTPCPRDWWGAQTTVQRWFADPLLNDEPGKGKDRTIRTVFTHDHFGPSTHQQTGLYAALLVEPARSRWYDNETGAEMGVGRADGGPTSWQAVIETPRWRGETDANTYREFAIALADTQLAYENNSRPTAGTTSYSPKEKTWAANSYAAGTTQPVINAPGCQPGVDATVGPCPSLISSGGTTGTMSVNYRNEPLPPRLTNAAGNLPVSTAPLPPQNDLAYVFASIERSNPAFNTQPTPGQPIGPSNFPYPPALTKGVTNYDPYTALLRAYEGDNVQIRLIAGAHVLPHTFGVNGVKWLFEPGTPVDPNMTNNSGYRNLQGIGISEHFELLFRVPRTAARLRGGPNFADYLYRADQNTSAPGLSDGMWGLFRAYRSKQTDLIPLSTNQRPTPLPPAPTRAGYSCPPGAPMRRFRVTAVPTGQAVRPGFTIVLNSRSITGSPTPGITTAQIGSDGRTYPAGLMYVRTEDLQNGVLKPGVPIEPLILRANAGDCIQVDLTNGIDLTNSSTAQTFNALGKTISPFLSSTLYASTYAGITPQVLAYDVTTSNGQPVGYNVPQVAGPKTSTSATQTVTYYWYAGDVQFGDNGRVTTSTAIELGGLNLTPADPLYQNTQGLVGAMVIEPRNTTHCLDWWSTTDRNASSRASARIYQGTIPCPAFGARRPAPLFHEFVSVQQDDMQNSYTAQTNDAINYRVEPILFRYNQPAANQAFLFQNDISCAVSNALIGSDPQTPVFQARAGEPMRMRMLHPGGNGNEQVMTLHGHAWQEEPFTNDSRSIGFNPASNALGSRDIHGPNDRFELVAQAGGKSGVPGDYLYRTFPAADFQGGMWGIVRVCNSLPCQPPAQRTCPPGSATTTSSTAAPSQAPDPTSKPVQRGEEFRRKGQNEKPPQP